MGRGLGISAHWLRHTTITWVKRSFGYAVACAYAGHTDTASAPSATGDPGPVVVSSAYTFRRFVSPPTSSIAIQTAGPAAPAERRSLAISVTSAGHRGSP